MKYILALLVVVGLGFFLFTQQGQEAEQGQTIYLIRHAEKIQDGSADPALTDVGLARAVTYAEYFANKGIKAIYSSNYKRNMDTVAPLAKTQGMEIQIYDPRDLEAIAKRVVDAGETALVAGHSNTTAELANILTGGSLETLEDKDYDRVYIIVLHKDGTSSVVIDHVEPLTP